MSGYQSSLSDSSQVAEELASEQREISIAEFFEQNKQMLGFGSETRAIVTAVKEAVDNALDAAEEADILPDIYVEITENDGYYTLVVEDNGPGIPKNNVPKVFGKLLYGSRFHQLVQRRGQQGIGISAAVMYAQLTSGNPARVTSKTSSHEQAYYVDLGIDTDTNQPDIEQEQTVQWDKKHGTRIEMDLEANMRARKRLREYITMTAVVNPHAKVELQEPGGSLVYDERAVDELPEDVEEIQPHPHGVELGALQDMVESTDCRSLRAFLQQEFTRVGAKTADNILDAFRDHYYGRELAWSLTGDSVDIEDYRDSVSETVKNKGRKATSVFEDALVEELQERDPIARSDVVETVENAATTATSNTNKRFAGTVQEKVVESIWDTVTTNVADCTITRVDNATTIRKSDDFVQCLGEELANEFEQIGGAYLTTELEFHTALEQAVERALEQHENSAFGDTASEKVFDAFWSEARTTKKDVPLVREARTDRDIANSLVEGMREARVMAPPTKCLSPITEDDIIAGVKTQYNADYYTSATRDAEVAGGDPFIVEAGLAYGGDIDPSGSIKLSRFANRVPLVYQEGACLMTRVVKDISWGNYYKGEDKLSQKSGRLPVGPMVLIVHVASTNVPFTSESKDAVAGVPEMEHEIELAVRDVARNLKDYLNDQRSRRKRERKERTIEPILNDIANKLETVTGDAVESKAESQARIMNNLLVGEEPEELRIKSFSGRSESVCVELDFDEKPTYPSRNVEREETADGWKLVFDDSISSGEEISITWNTDSDQRPSVRIKGVADAKVTKRSEV